MIIDIGTTVWNRPEMTRKFFESINLENYRLFILDQGSDKETYDLIRSYCLERENWIHLRVNKNIGACQGRIHLYNIMQSDYCILTDNDIVLPKNYSLQRQVDVLDKYPSVQCVVPRPTTAGGKKSIVGKSMNFEPVTDNISAVGVAGTLMQMHRRKNLITSKAYEIQSNHKWSTCEHVISQNFIAQGWKYYCIMDMWIDVQDQDGDWGYRPQDVNDRYDRGARIWDKRPVIADKETLEPLWHKEGYGNWELDKKYIRNKPIQDFRVS